MYLTLPVTLWVGRHGFICRPPIRIVDEGLTAGVLLVRVECRILLIGGASVEQDVTWLAIANRLARLKGEMCSK